MNFMLKLLFCIFCVAIVFSIFIMDDDIPSEQEILITNLFSEGDLVKISEDSTIYVIEGFVFRDSSVYLQDIKSTQSRIIKIKYNYLRKVK